MFTIKLFSGQRQEYKSALKNNSLLARAVRRLNKACEQAKQQERYSKSKE